MFEEGQLGLSPFPPGQRNVCRFCRYSDSDTYFWNRFQMNLKENMTGHWGWGWGVGEERQKKRREKGLG